MKITFYKYHGTGNDFILIDDRSRGMKLENLNIPLLSDRHFGIGSDGVILIRNHAEYDFEMVFFNPDGSQSFCGNGSRCAMQFAMDMGIVGDTARFLSTDGAHQAYSLDGGWVKLQMHDALPPVKVGNDLEINTGSPHYIRFRELEGLDLISEAHAVRNSKAYEKAGINVNFVEAGPDGIRMRTYERGVEDETLSCGTGVTAAALATHFMSGGQQGEFRMNVHTKGGDLRVEYNYTGKKYTNVYLCGPAKFIFKGEIEI